MSKQRSNLLTHFIYYITFLLLSLSQTSTAASPKNYQRQHPCMGTLFHLHLYASDPTLAESAFQAAISRIDQINLIASDYLPHSELSHINRAPHQQPLPLSHDLYQILSRVNEISKLTNGAFDVTIAHATQNWRRAKRQNKLPSPQQTAKALSLTNWRALKLDPTTRTLTKTSPNLLIDLGGIAKGYAADAALTILKQHGFHSALVAASGDLAIGNPPPDKPGWPVTLKLFDQLPAHLAPPKLLLHNCSVSTSGDLHQSIEINGSRYSHIINPHTALGLTSRIACTIITTDTTSSDALATAACVLGPTSTKTILSKLPSTSGFLIQLPNQLLSFGPAFHPVTP